MTYLGNCKTIVDERPDIFNDATEMAQAVDNSEPLGRALFEVLIPGGKSGVGYTYGKYKNMVWSYSEAGDTHYFYVV